MSLSWDFQSLPCTYMNAKDGEIGNKTSKSSEGVNKSKRDISKNQKWQIKRRSCSRGECKVACRSVTTASELMGDCPIGALDRA